MSSTLFTERHLKNMIKAAKEGRAVFFAFGEDAEGAGHLVADDELESAKLMGKLKSEKKTTSATHGKLAVEQTKLILSPEKSFRDLKKRVGAWADASGVSFSAITVADAADGSDENSPERRKVVETVGRAILDVLKHGRMDAIRVPAEFEDGIRWLWFANSATHLNGEERWEKFEQAVKNLAPVLKLDGWDSAMQTWIESYILKELRAVRAKVEDLRAQTRIEERVEVNEDLVMGGSSDRATMRNQLKKLAADADLVFGVGGLGVAQQMSAEDRLKLNVRAGGIDYSLASIDIASDALKVGAGLLALTDDELAKKLAEAGVGQPLLKNVRTIAELEKTLLDIASGVTGLATKAGILVANLKGNLPLAAKLEKMGNVVGKPLGALTAALSVTQGVCVLLDDKASEQEKWDAGANIASGSATLVATGAEIAGATAVAGAATMASAAIVAGYAAAKVYAMAYWSVRSDLMNAYAGEAFKTLDRAADRIATNIKKGDAACQLFNEETSDAQITALHKALGIIQADLGAAIDGLLTVCKEGGFFKGAAYPGSFTVFEEKFSPLQSLKGEKNPEKLVENAGAVMKAIAWCFVHAAKVMKAAALGAGVDVVEAMIKKEEEGG